jgi:hypothetical protein
MTLAGRVTYDPLWTYARPDYKDWEFYDKPALVHINLDSLPAEDAALMQAVGVERSYGTVLFRASEESPAVVAKIYCNHEEYDRLSRFVRAVLATQKLVEAHLDLDGNSIRSMPTHLGIGVHYLEELDLSSERKFVLSSYIFAASTRFQTGGAE